MTSSPTSTAARPVHTSQSNGWVKYDRSDVTTMYTCKVCGRAFGPWPFEEEAHYFGKAHAWDHTMDRLAEKKAREFEEMDDEARAEKRRKNAEYQRISRARKLLLATHGEVIPDGRKKPRPAN